MAKFEPGHKKAGGREKGAPNKKTGRFYEALSETGFDIIREFSKLYESGSDDSKRYMLFKAMEFSFAKPRAFEVEEENSEKNKTIEETIAELNAKRSQE